MRIADLVDDRRELRGGFLSSREHWVTDGTTVWQLISHNPKYGFGYNAFVDGSTTQLCEEHDDKLLFACWLADKHTYTGATRYG